ncbi:carcinoembryonic antigen-related cell adhesion molecule 1-like [Pseudorasbora parva]|uniref:carcinoembryonic antigen-related cell adhesion molecule 1-like n=1 Tax=Pseudorasbora parva TaxID=51549 RepID=UPI00351E3DB4
MAILLNLLLILSVLFDYDILDADYVGMSVMEGDSFTLHTYARTSEQEDIKWYFNDIRIAEISGDLSDACTDVQCEDGDERFRDRLKLDHQTGSLTVMNTRITDSGLYELKLISISSISEKIFNVTVHGVTATEQDKKSLNEGESVTLDPGVARLPNKLMKWYYKDILIAEITGDQSRICEDDQCKERFRDRLKLDHQTGFLTIMNTRHTDSGEYQVKVTNLKTRRIDSAISVKRFGVTVTVPGSGLSSGAVAGIVIGVLVPVAAAAAAVGFIYYRKSQGSEIQGNEPVNQEDPDL